MEFLILGPLELRDGSAPIRLTGARQRGLLALLLLHRNEVLVSDDVVAASERLPNLSYRGWLDLAELRVLFAGARVVLTPSTWEEPGALTSLEAMATGTPLVSYRSGGLTEYVEDAHAGLVVNNTPEELADAVREVSESRERWSGFSSAGLLAAATVHSHDAHGRLYEVLYEEVTELQTLRR